MKIGALEEEEVQCIRSRRGLVGWKRKGLVGWRRKVLVGWIRKVGWRKRGLVDSR